VRPNAPVMPAGTCANASSGASAHTPSGLSDWPRPFVLRAAHLDHRTVAPGQLFWIDINLFDVLNPAIDYFQRTFRELAAEGIGPGRGRSDLLSVEQLDRTGRVGTGSAISIPLEAEQSDTERIRVAFRTPTALKSDQGLLARPEFGTLFARARDRVGMLRSLYGAGPLEIDYRALGERASVVRMSACQIHHLATRRRSSRTGQSHSIGGFVGQAEYEGDLREFLPILQAAQWTGVGRHCVWGNGELRVEAVGSRDTIETKDESA
jgi:hypothetical protein